MFANMAIIFGSTLNRSACVSDKYFNVDLIIRVLWFYSCVVRVLIAVCVTPSQHWNGSILFIKSYMLHMIWNKVYAWSNYMQRNGICLIKCILFAYLYFRYITKNLIMRYMIIGRYKVNYENSLWILKIWHTICIRHDFWYVFNM